jgi:uncharacterized membrane protein YfcA
MDPWTLVFLLAVVFAATAAQTVAGFGFALIAVPLLVLVFDVEDVVVSTAIPALATSLLVIRSTWTHVPRRLVAVMLLGAFAGMPAGVAVLVLAPADVLRVAVALTSIVMAIAIMAGARLGATGVGGQLATGMTAGVLGTSTGINGPPVVLYLQDLRLSPIEFRGGMAAFFIVSGVTSLVVLAAGGVVTTTGVAIGLAAMPATFAGSWLGHRLVGRLSDTAFRRLVLGLLVVTALVAAGLSLERLLN